MKPRSAPLACLVALVSLGACSLGGLLSPPINSFQSALEHLERDLLPTIKVANPDSTLGSGRQRALPPLAESLPSAEAFPLSGADPQRPASAELLRLEIVSSAEKADPHRPDRRWLVLVAEHFNQRQERLASGRRIEVVIRTIPSGLAAQMLAAGKLRPAGYSPASEQWLALLQQQGLRTDRIHQGLVANTTVIALKPKVLRDQGLSAAPDFAAVVDQALAGRLRIGYSNPYTSSAGLDFLHTLLWLSAGHGRDLRPLTLSELQSGAVQGSFGVFQQQIATTAPTYIELAEAWKRNPDRFDAVVMAHQSYVRLQREPGFADLVAVPFGSPQDSPLAAFAWTTPEQRQALTRFAAFASSPPMQALARQWGYGASPPVPPQARPPRAVGEVLSQAQRQWKRRKDGGRTVYMQMVIDSSGSMNEERRLEQVKQAVAQAATAINPGNHVGLISFSDRPIRHLPLQPFDGPGHQRLLAAVGGLRADGPTALFDGLAVAMADLMQARRTDPDGRFVLLLLSDGQRTTGLELAELEPVIRHSGISLIPIAYGDPELGDLQALAAIRETTVQKGKPQLIQPLIHDLLQTNL
jgi:Ca-activated chloride channel family protein